MHRVKSVIPKDKHKLYVAFQNGVEKEYDVRQLYPVFPQFQLLEKTEALFEQVKVDVGGYGISWNDELDLEAEELWENGIETGRSIHVDIKELVGSSLTEARSGQKLTQKQLSEITGIYQADISNIERGKANPSIDTLNRLAEGMGMKLKISFEKDA